MARSKPKEPIQYCTDCGKQCVQEFAGYYDVHTGEKVYDLVCPDEPCAHGFHRLKPVKRKIFFGLFTINDYVCSRCGFVAEPCDHV